MSKYSDEFVVELAAESVMAACREAVANLGWRVMEQYDMRIVCKEVALITSFSNPAQIEIACRSFDKCTRISLKGSNFGFGPIQSGHVKGQVGNIRNRIEVALNSHKTYTPSNRPVLDTAAQIKNLADLHAQGLLSDGEFSLAKMKILRE